MIVGEKIILNHFLLLSGSKTKTAAVIKRRGNAIGNLDSRASLNFSLTESVISFYIDQLQSMSAFLVLILSIAQYRWKSCMFLRVDLQL